MEFWGVEVKAGEPFTVKPEIGHFIHLSQIALGEVKNMKAANSVLIHLKVDDKKLVIGTLSAERGPQMICDLVLEKEFELSHGWKDGSVFVCGYTGSADDGEDVPDDYDSSSDEEIDEDEGILIGNRKPLTDAPAKAAASNAPAKAAASNAGSQAKPKVTIVDPKKEESDEDDDSDSESSEDETDAKFDDDDASGDSDDDMSEDEETPKKVEPSKKRPANSAIKTPVSNKKSKTDTPQKTDGKKGSVHTATPHPSKKSEKKTADTPKSSGQVPCKSCSKTFSSEKGLESHSKAKHGGK